MCGSCETSMTSLPFNNPFCVSAALWALIVVMTWVFHSIEPLAGYLQLPYFAWVSFASVLNYTLLKLNTKPVRPHVALKCLAQHVHTICVVNSTHLTSASNAGCSYLPDAFEIQLALAQLSPML